MLFVESRNSEHDERFFSERSFYLNGRIGGQTEVVIGSGDAEMDVVLDKVLEGMKPSERAEVRFKISRKERKRLDEESEGLISIHLEVQLLECTFVKEIWEMKGDKLLAMANYYKQQGVDWFRENHSVWSLQKFIKAIRLLIAIESDNSDAQVVADAKDLRSTLHSNIAAIFLQYNNYESALQNCDKSLKFNPVSVKALYRRAKARAGMNDFEQAERDLKKALELEPENSALVKEMKVLKAKWKDADKETAKNMSKMFV